MVFSRLSEPIRKALAYQGYSEPTPIQARSIPPLLEGKDLLGIAQTGTGKTAAFLLPILQRFSAAKRVMPVGTPRALILAPTRELAAQIEESCRKYGKHLQVTHAVIFGGVSQGLQVAALRRGVDILVATPGRLLDLMQQGYIHLDKLEVFILDEADRMLDMGFLPDVKHVVAKLPAKRQTMFFSATMSQEIERLANGLLLKPERVEIATKTLTVDRIAQEVLFVDQQKKDALLWMLLEQNHLEKVLIFTRTKHRADKVARVLNKRGVKAVVIHGNRSQNQRTQALAHFHTGKARILVATDIAARGIDVKEISHVINYDLPNEPENYVHRIGRTARAGKKGVAYSFCAADERDYLRAIEKLIKMKLAVGTHTFHSEAAKNAKGADARPPPRGQRPPRNKRAPSREVKPWKSKKQAKPAGRAKDKWKRDKTQGGRSKPKRDTGNPYSQRGPASAKPVRTGKPWSRGKPHLGRKRRR